MIPLAAWEEIIDASGAAPRVEAMLPVGVRARQLSVRTLLAGMCLTQADGRPAHLTRVHRALTVLPEDEQRRLGVTADWKNGPHLLTYRQTEYTFGLVADALGKDEPDGLPSPELQAVCDQLLEASVPDKFKDASATPTGSRSTGRPRCAPPGRSWSRTCTRKQRPQGHPRRRHHQQRQSLLPQDTAAAAGTRTPRPRRDQGTSRSTRREDRRGRPLQARPPHR